MLVTLLAMYFLGGSAAISGAILTSSAVVDLEEQVAIVVEDPARKKAAKRTLKGLRKDVKTFEKSFARSGKTLNKLYAVHADNRDQALKVLEDLNSEWHAGQERALDARFALRANLSEDEWAALFGND